MLRVLGNLLAVPVAALLLSGCETAATSIDSTEAARTAVPLTAENRELLLGYWEGRWEADNGSSNAFSLDITEIETSGEIRGKRAYVTESYGSSARPTSGEIREGKLHLDIEKGPNSRIVLALEQDEASEELWLSGRYSAQGGDNVFLGDLSVRKWKDL